MKYLIFLLPSLLFADFSGEIFNINSSKPLEKIQISDGFKTVYTNKNGKFNFPETNSTKLHVKAYGYRPYSIELQEDQTIYSVKLTPIKVKALYVSFWQASYGSKIFQDILNTIEKTQINALVIDVKNEFGHTLYETNVPEAKKMRAYNYYPMVKNMSEFISKLKEKNLYLIARVVVFKDALQAKHYPDRAVKKKNGELWGASKNETWVDPFNEHSQNYAIEIAEDAAKAGFDEINFDYVRFPATDKVVLAKENIEENRVKTISSFLAKAQKRLLKYGVFTSADTYGFVCWNEDDTNIGHKIPDLAKNVDYLAPMLYPSGFPTKTMGFKDPTEHSYEIILQSILNMHADIDPIRVRPWLQHFKDYAHSRKQFDADEIKDQIAASDKAKASGWMFWNPSSKYEAQWLPKTAYLSLSDKNTKKADID